jgi:protein TonB
MILSFILLLTAKAAADQGMVANNTSPPPIVAPVTNLPPAMESELRQVVRPPQVRQPTQSLVSPDDYPTAANGVRGTVGITLLVDQQGKAVACAITRRSAAPALDFATCNLLKRRERFTPAVDGSGNASMGRIAVEVDWDKVFRQVRMR